MFDAIEIIARSFLTKLAELTKEAYDVTDEDRHHYIVGGNRAIGHVSPYKVADAIIAGKLGKHSSMVVQSPHTLVHSHTPGGSLNPEFKKTIDAVAEGVRKHENNKVSIQHVKNNMWWLKDHHWEVNLSKKHFQTSEAANHHLDVHGHEPSYYKTTPKDTAETVKECTEALARMQARTPKDREDATHAAISKLVPSHTGTINHKTDLKNHLNLNKDDRFYLKLFVEQAHDIWDISDKEAKRWKTVKDVHDTVHKYTGMTP